VGIEGRSLDNLFVFRESEKSLKMTPGGSFFMYPYRYEKYLKVFPDVVSCIYEHEKEQRLSSVCPQLDS
jgi:hypothetical protein